MNSENEFIDPAHTINWRTPVEDNDAYLIDIVHDN
jgi:hypothetical protein